MANPSTTEEMTTDLRTLTQDLAALKTDVKHLAQDALDAAKEKLADAKKLAADKVASGRGVIAEHPLTSVCVAAGVGVLAGLLIGRSRH